MYGDLGHEEHVLDLTNFDGEDDTRLPGETQLSHRLRKEGKLRRAKTRKSQGAILAKLELDTRAVETRSQPTQSPFTSKHPPPGFRSSTPPRELVHSPTASAGLRSPAPNDPLRPSSPMDGPFSPLSPRPNSFLYADPGETSRTASPTPSTNTDAFTVHDSEAYHSHRPTRHSRTQSKFGMDDAEAEDVPIVAERARPGRAKIDRIVADEAGRSRGAMVVACCGPTSLNAMVRKSVATQIDPARILRGDMRASIALVSEDFEW